MRDQRSKTIRATVADLFQVAAVTVAVLTGATWATWFVYFVAVVSLVGVTLTLLVPQRFHAGMWTLAPWRVAMSHATDVVCIAWLAWYGWWWCAGALLVGAIGIQRAYLLARGYTLFGWASRVVFNWQRWRIARQYQRDCEAEDRSYQAERSVQRTTTLDERVELVRDGKLDEAVEQVTVTDAEIGAALLAGHNYDPLLQTCHELWGHPVECRCYPLRRETDKPVAYEPNPDFAPAAEGIASTFRTLEQVDLVHADNADDCWCKRFPSNAHPALDRGRDSEAVLREASHYANLILEEDDDTLIDDSFERGERLASLVQEYIACLVVETPDPVVSRPHAFVAVTRHPTAWKDRCGQCGEHYDQHVR